MHYRNSGVSMRYSNYKRKNPLTPKLARAKKPAAQVKEVPSLDVFIVAAIAHRINNGKLIKDDTYERDENGLIIKTIIPNKRLVNTILSTDDYASTFTDQDREDGAAVQGYWRMKMFSILSGNTSSYIETSVRLASLETVKLNDFLTIACIAGLPLGMERGIVRDIRDEQRQDAQFLSEHLGKIGDKITGRVKVINCVFSKKWECYYMNGIVGTNVIMWANAKAVEVDKEYSFTGKVKNHRDNNVTQLHYVRLK